MSIAVEDGRITHVYAIRNPHKLAHLDGVAALTLTADGHAVISTIAVMIAMRTIVAAVASPSIAAR